MENFENRFEINNYDELANSISFDNTDKILNNRWWFSEITDYNGKKVFDFTAKNWERWEIVTEKSNNTEYKIRVKKWVRLSNWQDWWQTQKNWSEDLFSITAQDPKEFTKDLLIILYKTIWEKNLWIWNLVPFSITWNGVFEWLNNNTNESIENQWKTNLKKKPIDLRYQEINKEMDIVANYPKEKTSVEWRITRCLRFASITDCVEDRYGIPRWLLMAMMAQEWRWDPTVINQRSNGKCDWWAGLIHIQATNAADYWLNTIQRDNDSMADFGHWDRLIQAKENTNNNLAMLSQLDDRFNPVLGVDLAARYLMQFCGWRYRKTWDDWLKAVWWYNNKGETERNWNLKYVNSVLVYWSTINAVRKNPMPTFSKESEKIKKWQASVVVNWTSENVNNCISRTEDAINNLNPTFNGEIIPLNLYYTYLRLQRNNFGLKEYGQYNKDHPYQK